MTPIEAPGATPGWRWAAAAYLFFVVYGSLLPFDFHAMPIAEAWRAFLATPFFLLGVASRADWVANGILYLPLGILLSALAIGPRQAAGHQIARALAVFALCTAVAFGVEFVQLFFPPRTVSLNDLLAETIGSALGVTAWLVWGGAAVRMSAELGGGGTRAIRAAGVLYTVAYLGLSLFPFDLLVSADEFATSNSNRWRVMILA